VLVQFENAEGVRYSQPRVGAPATTLGLSLRKAINPEKGYSRNNPFRVESDFLFIPQGCRWRSNPGLGLANAFGVFQSEPL
jgi:hypothetical protein